MASGEMDPLLQVVEIDLGGGGEWGGGEGRENGEGEEVIGVSIVN